jgi:hypothetical protein
MEKQEPKEYVPDFDFEFSETALLKALNIVINADVPRIRKILEDEGQWVNVEYQKKEDADKVNKMNNRVFTVLTIIRDSEEIMDWISELWNRVVMPPDKATMFFALGILAGIELRKQQPYIEAKD